MYMCPNSTNLCFDKKFLSIISIKLRKLNLSNIFSYCNQSQPISYLKPIKIIKSKAIKEYKYLFFISDQIF